MNRDELFWERVNDALDARVDPLADERVQALVAERPERLDELLALRERIELVAREPAPRKSRRVAVAALVLVAVGGAAAWLAMRNAPTAERQVASASGESRVLSFQVRTIRESWDRRTTVEFDGARRIERTESLTPPRALVQSTPGRFVALVESVSFTR